MKRDNTMDVYITLHVIERQFVNDGNEGYRLKESLCAAKKAEVSLFAVREMNDGHNASKRNKCGKKHDVTAHAL